MKSPAPLRVAYQGAPGAYSEAASMAYFDRALPAGAPPVAYAPAATFPAVVEALAAGAVDRAVLPIENSLAGTIHANLDLLLRHPELTIVGEHDFRVRHCLLALPGTRLEDVKVVRSHYMAIAQCVGWLEGKGLVTEVAGDTAGSAERVRSESLTGAAAIASRRAAEIYDLDVLAEGIEDEQENYTRFLVLMRGAVGDGVGAEALAAATKTSIAFTLNNTPGALLRALSVFSVVDIDLTKIESRHVHTVLDAVADDGDGCAVQARRWGYVFYLDFARGYADEASENALRSLRQITPFFRCLGSYLSCQSVRQAREAAAARAAGVQAISAAKNIAGDSVPQAAASL